MKSFSFQYGTTPIIWASRRGHRDIVEMLVAEGANIDNAGMVRTEIQFGGSF